MIRNWIPSGNTTEHISSMLRWFFVIVCLFIAFYPPLADMLHYDQRGFLFCAFFVVVYSAAAQYTLFKYDEQSLLYKYIARSGVIFDGIAILCVVYLTGGIDSPFFPLVFLLTLHAAIYWRLEGAMAAALCLAVIYSLMLLFTQEEVFYTHQLLYKFVLQLMFIFTLGFYGGVISSRERKHYRESKLYKVRSIQDDLTGLYNHRYFQETLQHLMQEGRPAYLVMADIDRFKYVNDSYGHLVGDDILKEVGKALQRSVSGEQGIAFRYGGEEFALIYFDKSLEVVTRRIQRIKEDIERNNYFINGHKIHVTLSFGVLNTLRFASKNEAVQRTDELLYMAKREGRNAVVLEADDGSTMVC